MQRILQSIHTWCLACVRSVFRTRHTEALLAPLDTLPLSPMYCIAHAPYTIYSLGRYDTPLWHALMYEIKFHAHMHAVLLLAPHVQRAALHLMHRMAHPHHIIPMPLHPARERARGYNQVTRVLEACPDTHALTRADLLQRTIHRVEQKTLNRTRREQNVAHSFTVPVHARADMTDAHILLIDDICATGATVREAARTCSEAGAASVTILVFCNS